MIVVFLGPTLPHVQARADLDALYLGPAAQGDLYRAARRGATAIGLIDGFFHSVPSVWHKEILWALSENVPVYGSASMGALRAAELWQYGMIGVGKIFEAYRNGVIIDDDEVALTHTDAEHGYQATSEPMVDIRATVAEALRTGEVDDLAADALLRAAKDLYYPNRLCATIVREAGRIVGDDRLERFAKWWAENRISQKRLDAIAMLKRMASDKAEGTRPVAPQFWFERTALWDDLIRQAHEWDGRQLTRSGEDRVLAAGFGSSAAENGRDATLARVLALDEARRHQLQLDDETLHKAIVDFRLGRSLLEPEDLERWMAENNLDKAGFLRLMVDEARINWVRSVLDSEIEGAFADHLRVTGQFRTSAQPATLSDSGEAHDRREASRELSGSLIR